MDDLGLIYDVVLGRNRHIQHQHRERESEEGLLLKDILINNNLCCLNETDIQWIFRRPSEWPFPTVPKRQLFGGIVESDENRQFALSE